MSSHRQQNINILCVPTEAGTHFPGQCNAPEALIRTAGLQSKLESVGYSVFIDDQVLSSDVYAQAARWVPAPKKNGVRNEANTLTVMRAVQQYLRHNKDGLRNSFPIILGGDCSITPAVFSGLCSFHSAETKVGLLYIDGDADLTLPGQTDADGSSAILDSMTISHLTGRRGGLESMQIFAGANGSPLITPDNIVLFGFDPLQPAVEHWVYLLEHGFKAFTRPTVRSNPLHCAKEALAWLQEKVDVIYVHFDVDVIDSGEFPLANYPHYAGLSFTEAMDVLHEVLKNDIVHGLTLTEINPNNDPNGTMVRKVVDGVVEGMARRRSLKGEAPSYS